MAKKSKKAKKADQGASSGAASHVLRAAEIGARQESEGHPWNPNAEMIGVDLGKRLGLKRTSVSIARVPAGKECGVPEARHREEQWVYVLMGQGLARIGEEEIEVGSGDFLAYPAPQILHHLKNIGGGDLVYLTGGETAKMDVVDYPTLGKRAVRLGETVTVYDAADGAPWAASYAVADEAPKTKPKKKSKK